MAGDFNGDGRADLAVANSGTERPVQVLLGNGDGTFSGPGQLATTPQRTPLVADVNGDGTDDVLVVDGAGDILYRQGIPGQPGTFEPPVTVNPRCQTARIPILARHRLDPEHRSRAPCSPASMPRTTPSRSTLIATGAFVRVGSLTTGQLPAQIIAADSDGDGLDDLVVRNAGDGTLSVYFGTSHLASVPLAPSISSRIAARFLPPVTLARRPGRLRCPGRSTRRDAACSISWSPTS